MERDEALNMLRWNWGEAYDITETLGEWRAVRFDTQRVLLASTPDDLRVLIIADYSKDPVARRAGT